MDRRKSILNVSVSIAFKIITIVMSLLARRLLIRTCGNDINGLNALYLSIIGFLSVAELGVGSAITFCMYRPIVEGNQGQVAALYSLFRKIYWLIGGVVLVAGVLLTPFIHHFAKDYSELDVNLYSSFVLMLVSVVITYAYGAKTSLINAYKNNYITTAITSGGLVLQYVCQIIVLVFSRSFGAYLCCRIVAAAAQWIAAEVIARRKHRDVVRAAAPVIDNEIKEQLLRSIKAMFMHKVGEVIVSTVDGIVIAANIGVVVLGAYTNYTIILNSMTGIISLIFGSLTAVLGHFAAKENRERVQNALEGFHLINFCIGILFYLGFYAIADSLVAMLFSPELVCDRAIVFVITLNGFVQYMRRSVLVFRDATGTFYQDRWKPIVEGTLNLILSLALVKAMGVIGVIVATIITTLTICHVVEPFVLYKNVFKASPLRYFLTNYGYVLLFFVGMMLVDILIWDGDKLLANILINGTASVLISILICAGILLIMRKRAREIIGFFTRRREWNE